MSYNVDEEYSESDEGANPDEGTEQSSGQIPCFSSIASQAPSPQRCFAVSSISSLSSQEERKKARRKRSNFINQISILSRMSLQRLEAALEFQEHYEERVAEAADFLRTKLGERERERKPEFGIVLGSGLGDLADS
ncbi:MAG: hypothetical protein AABX98_05690, partial [Nanoarchaeota archaeon]